jgi:hypothetical protein
MHHEIVTIHLSKAFLSVKDTKSLLPSETVLLMIPLVEQTIETIINNPVECNISD